MTLCFNINGNVFTATWARQRKYSYESREATFKTYQGKKKKKDIDSDEPMKDPGQNLYIHSLCEHLLTAYYMRAPS